MRRIPRLITPVMAVLCLSSPALGDGAFPDSMQIILPQDKPNEILVGTNFGLLVSEDDGASWRWVCEEVVAACARLYQVSAPPSDTILSVTAAGITRLTNDACTRGTAVGFENGNANDVFADPVDHDRIYAIASSNSGRFSAYASDDAGQTFGAAIYAAGAGEILSGIESARSDAQTLYLAQFRDGDTGIAPTILRSKDGGKDFEPFDHSSTLKDAHIYIIAVDRADANTLFLRVTDPATHIDSLAVSDDGGETSATKFSLPPYYDMTSFVEMSDGTILVAGIQAGSPTACGASSFVGDAPVAGYVSTDGGRSFQPWMGAPHARALGERAGVLYAVGDNFVDGFAVASSTDLGAHWTPLLRFDRIAGPVTCLASACASSWATLESTFGIGDAGSSSPSDGGTDGGGGMGGCTFTAAAQPPGYALLAAALLFLGRRSKRGTSASQRG